MKDYNIDITGLTVKFLNHDEILLDTDLVRPIFEEETTYRPKDYDVFLFHKVSWCFPAWTSMKINENKYHNLFEFIRIIE